MSDKWNEQFKKLQDIDNSLSNIVQTMIDYNKQLLAIPVDRLKDVSTQFDNIKTALESVQNDNLSVINAAINVIERNAEDLTKPLKDQLDLLNKQADARQRQVDIEQAAWNLEKARNQKTVSVVRNGRITYEADQDNVRNAQNSYQEAKDSAKKSELQAQIDAINDNADKLKEKWQKIQSDTEHNTSVEKASKLAGMSAEEFTRRILTGDDANLYNTTKSSYEDVAKQQASLDEISGTLSAIQSMIEEINTKYLSGQLTSEQAKNLVNNLINAGKDGLTGAERLSNQLAIEQKRNSGVAVEDAKKTISETSEEYNKTVKQTDENNSVISEYQKKRNELDAEIQKELERAKQAYKNLKDAENAGSTYRPERSGDNGGSSSNINVTGKIYFRSDSERDSYNKKWGTNHNSSDSTTPSGVSPTKGYVDVKSDRKSSSSKGSSKSRTTGRHAVKFADGIENGMISGVGKTNSSDEKFRLLQEIAVRGFKPAEVPIVADIREAVLNPKQQANILEGFGKSSALGFAAGAALRSSSANVKIEVGDIVLPDVKNSSEFADTMAQTFESKMQQTFSKIFK